MTYRLIFDNLVAYSLQIGMLIGVAAFVPALLRLRQPGAKLLYWQILLVVCLLLPLQPWRQIVTGGSVQVSTAIVTISTVRTQAPARMWPRSEIALLVLVVGIAVRLGWLATGFWKLRRYRRNSEPLVPAPSWSVEASLRISEDIESPVTFGWRKPVVLLPAGFAEMAPQVQDAILCHEVMHVRRRDWLFTIFEEMVRAIFWFHPAIWWLLGEIGLAREQEVDRLAIGITNERDQYMDALMAIAGAHTQLELAPAPLFLRKRHLKHRVVLILKETQMSKQRLIPTLATGLGILAAACWLVTGAFPLTAQPQVVYDAPGVTVNLNGASVMHRSGINYPRQLIQQGVQGMLLVEVKTDANGNVSDARVLTGPDELRRSTLASVLDWHFTRAFANTTRTVQIAFEVPKETAMEELVVPGPGVVGGVVGGVPGGVAGGVVGGVAGVNRARDMQLANGGVLGGIIGSVPAGAPPPPPSPELMAQARIAKISVYGLPDEQRSELLASLPVREGDLLTPELLQRTSLAARAFDEHLSVSRMFQRNSDGGLNQTLTIMAPGARMGGSITTQTRSFAPASGEVPSRLKIAGDVQAGMILKKVTPVYPALALSARVAGVVHLVAIIGKDGTLQEAHVVGGPALLQQSALDAVRQWVYRPTLLNGEPVAVETTIDIDFELNQ